jgi:tRNA A-37 threonylcarbamoyl transferase component Bud32/tetratricopeptide (TPR) repeat protein
MPTPLEPLQINPLQNKFLQQKKSRQAAKTKSYRKKNLCARSCLFIAFLIFTMLPAFFSPAAAQNQNDLKRAQEFYEKALQEKKPVERAALLQKAVRQVEPTPSAALLPASRRQIAVIYFALGREFFQQAKWQLAVIHLEKAVAVDSTLLSAHTTLGLIYFQQRKYDAAIAAYHKVLPTQPTAQLCNNLGAAYEAKGELSAAVEAYRRAVELEPGLILAQKNLQRAQKKWALTAPVFPSEKIPARADSARLAEQRRDSLAAEAQKLAPGAAKIKSKKEKKNETGKVLAAKTQPLTKKHKDKEIVPKNKLVLRPPKIETKASSVFRSKDSTKISAASPARTIGKPAVAPTVVIEPATAPLQNSSITSVTSNSTGSSVFAYICAAAVLFGVFIFTQRRRLSRVWLQFKPALATPATGVIREERLIPSAIQRRAIDNGKVEAEIKFLPNRPAAVIKEQAVVETETSNSATTSESLEPRHPSLQTQAFFAEMIAADPEIEGFDDDLQEDSDAFNTAVKPANGHADSSPLPDENKVDDNEEPMISSPPAAAPISTPNGKNGHDISPPFQAETTGASTPSKSVIALDSASQKLDRVETNHNAAQISLHHDNEQTAAPTGAASSSDGRRQPRRSEDRALSGERVLGRYQIEREIGKGAMGNIYLAFDPKLDRRVVIKTVCFNLAASEADTSTLKDRVYREARAIAKLGHPNIVVVYDVEDDKDFSYIVMEHIEGRDLRQALKSERRLDFQRAIKIVAQVCSALDYAHQAGIIHRDIKPSNIMLLPNDKAKVTDFGIAKLADNFSLTLPGHVLGTPSYMAPEQLDGETIDSRADIFSLGVVLYELLTGCRPFAGDSLAALAYKIVHKMQIPPSLQNVELPIELDDIVARALAKQPQERYQTAQEFREALLALNFAIAA